MMLAADPRLAEAAQYAGIDRIFFDLEFINKIERQRGRNTVISNNRIEDMTPVRNIIDKSKLLVRVNPINPYSKREIDEVIERGADIIMLPMTLSQHDAELFVEMVGARAKTCVMVETAQALTRVDDIIQTPGVDEIFIGLNDLHISLGLSFMFEPLSGGLVEYLGNKSLSKFIPFGFGGIARIGEGILPADMILGEHIRLGSSSVILSRTFKGEESSLDKDLLKDEVNKVRNHIAYIKSWEKAQFEENKNSIKQIVTQILSKNK